MNQFETQYSIKIVQHVLKQKKEVKQNKDDIPNSGMKMRRYKLLKMNSMDNGSHGLLGGGQCGRWIVEVKDKVTKIKKNQVSRGYDKINVSHLSNG